MFFGEAIASPGVSDAESIKNFTYKITATFTTKMATFTDAVKCANAAITHFITGLPEIVRKGLQGFLFFICHFCNRAKVNLHFIFTSLSFGNYIITHIYEKSTPKLRR